MLRYSFGRWAAAAVAVVLLVTSGVLAADRPALAWVDAVSNSRCSPTQPVRPAMHVTYDPALPANYRTAVRAAAAAWEEALPGLITLEVSAEPPATFHANTSYVTVYPATGRRDAYASAGASACGTAGTGTYDTGRIDAYGAQMDGLTQLEKVAVMIHEFGHLLSLNHPVVNDRCRSVMSHIGCPGQDIGPYPDDIAGVLASLAPNATPGFPADAPIVIDAGLALHGGGEPGGALFMNRRATDTSARWTFVPQERAGVGPAGERAGVIVNTLSALCLASWSTDNGHEVATEQQCYERSDRAGLFWSVQQQADGTTTLRNQKDGQCLLARLGVLGIHAVLGGCDSQNARMIISHPETAASPAVPGSQAYPLVGQQSARCIDVPDSDTKPGRQLGIWDCNNGSNQKVRFHDEGRSMTVFDLTGPGDVDGPDLTLCVAASGVADNSTIVTARCRQGDALQVWHHRGDGTIYNPVSNKCINVAGGATGNGSRLILWSCTTTENEVFNDVGALGREPRVSVRTLLGTGKVLTATAGNGVIGNDVNGENQNWAWAASPTDPASGMLTSWRSTSGTEELQCLTASAESAPTIVRTCSKDDLAQRWKPSTNTNGSTTFTNVRWSGQCLDVTEGKTDEGTAIVSWGCKTSGDRTNQQWRILPENPPGAVPAVPVPTAEVSLSARANSRQVTVVSYESNVLWPKATTVGADELFDLVFNNDDLGSVSFRSRSAGRFVTVDATSTELRATAGSIGDREKFTLTESTEGWVALLSKATGKYVVAESGGDGVLLANRAAIGPWEKFDLSGNHHLPEIAWNPGLGGTIASAPAVTFDPGQSRYVAAARTTSGAIAWKVRATTWTGWNTISPPAGTTIVGRPALTASRGRIELWALTSNTRVYSITSTDSGRTWGPWTDPGLPTALEPPAVAFDAVWGDSHIVVRSTDGTTWHSVRTLAGQWVGSQKILFGVPLVGEPAITVFGSSVDVFARGADDKLYQTYSRTNGSQWTVVEGVALTGGLTGSPAAAYDPAANVYLVAVKGADGKAYLNRWNADWSGWKAIPGPTGGTFTDSPALVAYGYTAQLFARGTDGYGWYTPVSAYY